MKSKIIQFGTEFIMVFLGVLLAFLTNSWAERKRDEKYVASILNNFIHDVREDSTQITLAIALIKKQHDSLGYLIDNLGAMNFNNANPKVGWAYKSYNVFDPTTQTFESMVFGGDMKLVEDLEKIGMLKDLDHINKKLKNVHEKYYTAIESFRNSFICQYDMGSFDFAEIPQDKRMEFWNRINFLRANVFYYYEILLVAQLKYNNFLDANRVICAE